MSILSIFGEATTRRDAVKGVATTRRHDDETTRRRDDEFLARIDDFERQDALLLIGVVKLAKYESDVGRVVAGW